MSQQYNMNSCPRCGERSFESFSSHDYCSSCNYSNSYLDDHEVSVPKWALDAFNSLEEKESKEEVITLPKAKEVLNAG